MVPKVDTFALDISDEIKRKNATLEEVVTPHSGNEGSVTSSSAPKTTFPIPYSFIVIVFGGIIALSLLTSFLYSSYLSLTSTPQTPTQNQEIATTKKNVSVAFLSKTLSQNIERHVSAVEKKDKGVVITFTSYSYVFSYITRHEEDYAHELVAYFFPQKSAQSQESLVSKKTTQKTTTTNSSTTQTTSSSTTSLSQTINETSTTTEEVSPKTPTSLFRDITMFTTNIRSYLGENGSVAYAFISDSKLIIAATPDDVIIIKNMITR